MKREIKFRLIDSITNEIIVYEEIDEKGNFWWYYKDTDKGKDFGTGSFDIAYLGDGFLGEIIRDQYTGLKDKNGIEIYEHDILIDVLGTVYQVYWESENGRFLGLTTENRIIYPGREPKAEIIGNIYDNLDLFISKTS